MKLFKQDRFLLAITIISIFLSFLLTYLSASKYYAMHATAYDLGIYSQALYTALHGKLFYSNLLGNSYLSNHFSPILFILLVPYAIFQSPITLLTIQAFTVSLAATPLYLITKYWLNLLPNNVRISQKSSGALSFVVSISYLISPMTLGPITFDFHLMALLPLFYFLSFYFFLRGNKKLWILFLVLIITLHSVFVIIVISTLVLEFLIYRSKNLYKRNENLKIRSRASLVLFLYFVLALAILLSYYYAVGIMKPVFSGHPLSLTGPHTYQYGSSSNSILGLILSIFTNPSQFINSLQVHSRPKTLFLEFAFGTSAFISVVFPEAFLAMTPYFFYGLPSSFESYYLLGYQYSMLLIPMVYIGSAGAIIRIIGLGRKRKSVYRAIYVRLATPLIVILILIGTVGGFVYTPIAPQNVYQQVGQVQNLWKYTPSQASIFVQELQKKIPGTSYIVTQNDVFPFFSNYLNSYSTPWSPGLSKKDFQYIVGDYNSGWVYQHTPNSPSIFQMENSALKTGNYGVFAQAYGIFVLERNYTQNPFKFVPLNITYLASSLHPSTPEMNLTNSTLQVNNITAETKFFTSRNSFLFPGTYTLTVTYESSTNLTGNKFTVSVLDHSTNLNLSTLSITESSSTYTGNLMNQNITFAVNQILSSACLMGSIQYWEGSLSLMQIQLTQISWSAGSS